MPKENSTKSFVLRVDGDTWEALEKWASDEFRSVNGQLQWIIAEALRKSGRSKKKKYPLHRTYSECKPQYSQSPNLKTTPLDPPAKVGGRGKKTQSKRV